MPVFPNMLKEILSDKKIYIRVIKRMSASTIMLPGSHILIHNPLDHIFTDEEAAALRFRVYQSVPKKIRLPKWFADEPPLPGEKNSAPGRHRIILALSAVNAVNRLCNLMSRGDFHFSRFRAIALLKRSDNDKNISPTKPMLLLSRYRCLTATEKSAYRLMLKPTFPDSLVLKALADLLNKLFPKSYFFRECCAYIAERGTKETVRQVMAELKKGYRVVLRLDIKSFNETVPQEKLLDFILQRGVPAQWDDNDIDLLKHLMIDYFSRIDEILGTPGIGIGMGTGLTPLFTNIYLHHLDAWIKEQKIPFCRFGDDLVLFFKDLPSAEHARADSIRFVETELGQQINEAKAVIVELRPVMTEQTVFSHGFDFCAYHYYINKDNTPAIEIKEATIGKIRQRIRLLTRIPHAHFDKGEIEHHHLAIGDIYTSASNFRLARRIWKISTLLGFPPKRVIARSTVHTYALGIGWPPSFLNDVSSEDIRQQFMELDRYILFRMARFEQATGGDTSIESKFYQKMRNLGLRTFIDAWNRHPRPYRY